jgi:hypothetical protein
MSTPSVILFDYSVFQIEIPQYADYSESSVEIFWEIGTAYVSRLNSGYMTYKVRQYALNLMCAHLIYINNLISQKQTPTITTSATVDKVSVGLVPPPAASQFEYWLGTSPYGQQLLALLDVNSVGGFYFGGSSVLSDFGYYDSETYYSEV